MLQPTISYDTWTKKNLQYWFIRFLDMCFVPTSLLNYAGTFTTNVVAAAPVLYCKEALEKSATVCYYKPNNVSCRGFLSAGTLALRQ